MNKAILLAALAVLAVLAVGCGGKLPENTFVDSRDGQVYRTARVGRQVWMAENLNYAADGSKCYDNDSANCDKYGRLYDWNTAMSACPDGFHLPSHWEWETLARFAHGNDKTYNASASWDNTAGKKLKSTGGWKDRPAKSESQSPDELNGNGTDDYGFAALPGGSYNKSGFDAVGRFGWWWSSTEDTNNPTHVAGRGMFYGNDNVLMSVPEKTDLRSVRCVMDDGKGGGNDK